MSTVYNGLDCETGLQVPVCVIGDILLDVVTHLNSADLTEYIDLKRMPNAIDVLPGGTGTLFALAAVQEGFSRVHLIGKLGADPDFQDQPDIAGRLVVNELRKAQVNVVAALDPALHTGVTMITYLPDDQRLLVVDKGASDSFTQGDVSVRMREAAIACKILFVSGYSLLRREQASAVFSLMQESRRHGCLVVLDVVPHSLHRLMGSAVFQRLTEPVGVLVSEINTMKRFFFSGEESLPTSDVPVDAVAERLLKHYDAVILRPATTYQYVIDRQGTIEAGPTGYEAVSPHLQRGYSDRMTARLLSRHYLRLMPTPTEHESSV